MKPYERAAHGIVVVLVALGLHLLLIPYLQVRLIIHFESHSNDIPDYWGSILAWGFWAGLGLILSFATLAIVTRLSWKIVLPLVLVEIGAFTYLLWDAPERPAPADLGPRISAADESYHVIMWMSKDSPFSRLKEPRVLPGDVIDLRLPANRSAWPEHVRKHRQEIMAAWDQDALGREWVDAINAHPPQGIWPQRSGDPRIDSQSIRLSSFVRWARAYVLAVEGQRDEAIQSLIPLLSCWQHLQCSGECLVTEMIADAVMKQSYGVIEEILKLGPVTNETMTTLRTALEQAPPVRQVFRNAYLGGQDFYAGVFDKIEGIVEQPSGGDSNWFIFPTGASARLGGRMMARLCYKLYFNRNQTQRDYFGNLQRVYELAAAREIDRLKETEKPGLSWAVKNAVGASLTELDTSAHAKAVTYFWQVEDQRRALLAQLEKP